MLKLNVPPQDCRGTKKQKEFTISFLGKLANQFLYIDMGMVDHQQDAVDTTSLEHSRYSSP